MTQVANEGRSSTESRRLTLIAATAGFLLLTEAAHAFYIDGLRSGMTLNDVQKLNGMWVARTPFASDPQDFSIYESYDLILKTRNFIYMCRDRVYGYARRVIKFDQLSELARGGQHREYALPSTTESTSVHGRTYYIRRYIWKNNSEYEGIRFFSNKKWDLSSFLQNKIPTSDGKMKYYPDLEGNSMQVYEERFLDFKCLVR